MYLVFAIGALLASYFVLSPLFLRHRDFSEIERLTFEKQDLLRLLESLEFDLQRGLISRMEYEKQKQRARERMKLIETEAL